MSCRHVKINRSPVSLTENTAVFRKTDLKKKKSQIFKNPLIVLPFFLLKAISCDNLAEVAESLLMKINIDIVRKLGSFE